MTANITTGLELLKNSVENITIFGISDIAPTALIPIICVMITRDIQKWKILAFPVTILLHIIGIEQNLLVMIIAGMMFVIENVSLQLIGELLDVVRGKKRIKEELKMLKGAEKQHKRKMVKSLSIEEVREAIRKGTRMTRMKKGESIIQSIYEKEPEKRRVKIGSKGKGLVREVGDMIKGVEQTSIKDFKGRKRREYEKYKQEGTIKQGTAMGLKLRTKMSEVSKSLGRQLTDGEIKKLYDQVWKEEGKK